MKAHNLVNEYVNASFMSANEKFNSAMVFETQPKDAERSEKTKLERMLQGEDKKEEDVEMDEEKGQEGGEE